MKFRLVTRQFGYPLYAMLVDGMALGTDNPEEAELFDHRDTGDLKASYWSSVTGLSFEVERVA